MYYHPRTFVIVQGEYNSIKLAQTKPIHIEFQVTTS